MTEDVTTRARAALEGVDEGPWRWCEETEYLVDSDDEQVSSFNRHNTEFIAASRSLVPELLAEVESLRARLKAMNLDNANIAHNVKVSVAQRDRANAEVERLRQLWEEAHGDDTECDRNDWIIRTVKYRAEVERLRGALDSIGRLADMWSKSAAAKDGDTVDILNALFARAIRDVLRGDQ